MVADRLVPAGTYTSAILDCRLRYTGKKSAMSQLSCCQAILYVHAESHVYIHAFMQMERLPDIFVNIINLHACGVCVSLFIECLYAFIEYMYAYIEACMHI